jgi:Ran GTPase-activating protein (RanGAP) involved in mRNA processing and transport
MPPGNELEDKKPQQGPATASSAIIGSQSLKEVHVGLDYENSEDEDEEEKDEEEKDEDEEDEEEGESAGK